MQTKRIIEEYNLDCTEEEFESYYEWLEIDTTEYENIQPEIRTFDQPYNGKQISNPANWKYYYIIEVAGKRYLQKIVPHVSGFQPLTDDNIDTVTEDHKEEIIQNYVKREKLRKTIEFFSWK